MATNSDKKDALPIHPGSLIKREMERRSISQRKMAIEVGISPSQLNEYINCKRPLNAETALLFSRALGLDAEKLLIFQAKYDLKYVQTNRAFLIRLKKVLRIEDEPRTDS